MARKVMFEENIFLEKAQSYIQEYGIDSMNARSLCEYVGCSTQPLFKNFNSMDEFKLCLRKYLILYYEEFIDEILEKDDYLYTLNFSYSLFALEEPNLFKALFMSELIENQNHEDNFLSFYDSEVIQSVVKQYGGTKKQAEKLCRDVFFYTHGLSCQIACKSISMPEREIKKLIRNIIKCFKKSN